ncbi:MAG: hypothetical protein KIH62_003745 [Candidatus Kerfeldbacteria bacterium]|nr:hypothetical protein [Candidatus Kerfeldbacteria bacterium]
MNTRVFERTGRVAEILKEVMGAIPKGTHVYMIGGAARNAVHEALHKKALPQRDYDLLLMGDFEGFVKKLRTEHGFTYGKIRRKNQIVLRKKLVPKPQSVADYVYLDIDRTDDTNVLRNLREHAAFTINGFAIPLKKFLVPHILPHVIALPQSIADIKNKRLVLNLAGYQYHAGNLFAALRFMSLGFKPPRKSEIALLLQELPKLEAWRFDRNVKKVFGYVGGEKHARALVKRLGITVDIFNQKKLRAL